MHPRILAQRTGIASEKLVLAARRLAQAIDLPEELVNALMPATNNSQIKPMLVLEACANLVEAAANKLAGTSNKLAGTADKVTPVTGSDDWIGIIQEAQRLNMTPSQLLEMLHIEVGPLVIETTEGENITISAGIEPTGDGGVAILLEPQAEPTQEPAPEPKPAYLNRKAKKA